MVFYCLLLFCIQVVSGIASLPYGDLDAYLQSQGYFLNPIHSKANEGYSSLLQRATFFEDLQKMPQVKRIFEIGFNGGHTSELFLNSSVDAEVVSLDINMHPYTKIGVEFIRKKYGDRFEFIEGDSRVKVLEYAESHPGDKFDLIFIDGCHTFDACVADIKNCQRLAHKDTLVWIDDYCPVGVKTAVDHCIKQGLLTLIEAKTVTDESGERAWAIARYPYLSDAEKVFARIYEEGTWGKNAEGEGTSGPGSWLEHGQYFIDFVQDFLNTHSIDTIVDVGCGDWVLSREIDWGNRHYLGIDVVQSVIEKNQAKYGKENIRFLQADGVFEPLPHGDLLICKDILMHLPTEHILRILEKATPFKYCIFINDTDPSGMMRQISDAPVGGFRCLDLTLPPFNLKPVVHERARSAHAIKQLLLVEQVE
ncbi:MAG: class I SAM-dependent methyltransferase [Verrucomicrobia bacterium]|nr:class I SAM-dependent methyltransferase [Verrucomicrobiota bacterium]